MIGKRSSIMPGYQTCEIADADNSRWVLKVGVGALVRTVKVQVQVLDWAGPERVDFSFKLEGDPVTGSGSYFATVKGATQTEMTLRVQVAGNGPMVPKCLSARPALRRSLHGCGRFGVRFPVDRPRLQIEVAG